MKRLHGSKSGGALGRIMQQVPSLKLPAREKRALPDYIEKQVIPEILELTFTIEDAFRNMSNAWYKLSQEGKVRALRLTSAVYRHEAFLGAETAGHHLATSMDLVGERLRGAITRLSAGTTLLSNATWRCCVQPKRN